MSLHFISKRRGSLSLAFACCTLSSACKFEPVEYIDAPEPVLPSTLDPRFYLATETPVPESSIRLQASFAKHLEQLQASIVDENPSATEANFVQYITEQYQAASLAPDGDGRGWIQKVPLRHLATKNWELKFSIATGGSNKSPTVQINQDDSDWVLSQFRNAGEHRETLNVEIIHWNDVSPAVLDTKDLRGRFVLIDATVAESSELLEQLRPNAKIFETLSSRGVAGCLVVTGLDKKSSTWQELRTRWSAELVDLLAPGEALPQRLDMIALTNGRGKTSLGAWLQDLGYDATAAAASNGPDSPTIDTTKSPIAPNTKQDSTQRTERAKPSPDAKQNAASALVRRARIEIRVESQARWDQSSSVLGRLPGKDHPEHVVLIMTHWDGVHNDASIPDDPSLERLAALVAQLGLLEKARIWHDKGLETDASIVFASFAGGPQNYAGIRQFIRQQTVRPGNLRAVINLESLSIRSDAIGVAVQAQQIPDWLRNVVEQHGGNRFRYTPPTTLSLQSPVHLFSPLHVAALTFTQRPFLRTTEQSLTQVPDYAALAALAEDILEIAWSIADLSPHAVIPMIPPIQPSDLNESSKARTKQLEVPSVPGPIEPH